MRFLLALLLPLLALPAHASITTYICSGSIKTFYLDWDGSRYTVLKQSTITLNVNGDGTGYVMMDLGREPLVYKGPLYLDGTHEHLINMDNSWGDRLYFVTSLTPSRILTFSARITNRNNVITWGVHPSMIDCK